MKTSSVRQICARYSIVEWLSRNEINEVVFSESLVANKATLAQKDRWVSGWQVSEWQKIEISKLCRDVTNQPVFLDQQRRVLPTVDTVSLEFVP